MSPRRVVFLLAATLVLGACNGDTTGDTPDAASADEAVTFRAVGIEPFEDVPSTVPAGEVTLRLVNDDQIEHSLRIEGLDDGVDTVSGGDEASSTVSLDAGTTYTFYCGVPGHREAGMEGRFDTAD